MSNNFLGEVRPFAGNFAPTGWALCNGQLLPIAQNSALFSLIGTTYGGNGVQTFALPNLQGRLAMSQGTGSGLTPRTLGEMNGTEQVTLLQSNLPVHTHTLNATTANATSGTISNSVLLAAPSATGAHIYTLPGTPAPTPETLSASSCGIAGSSLPHNNLMPSLCVSFIIALVGIFPSRN
jgi:microcystin-dependent protein